MKWLIVLLALALVLQIVLFLYARKLKKKQKESVIEKYNLRTPKDAWDAMANPQLPDEDKEEIKKLYEGKV